MLARFALGLTSLTLAVSSPAGAQDLATVCGAVGRVTVGQWAGYRLTSGPAGDVSRMRVAVVGRETTPGGDLLWHETSMESGRGAVTIRMLVPADPYDPTDIHRAVVQVNDQAPMELPANQLAAMREQLPRDLTTDPIRRCGEGVVVGWESVKVPVGTFRALHVRHERDGRTADVWMVPTVPFGMVRTVVAGDSAATAEIVLTGFGVAVPARAPGR
jgi:hypothetical protein